MSSGIAIKKKVDKQPQSKSVGTAQNLKTTKTKAVPKEQAGLSTTSKKRPSSAEKTGRKSSSSRNEKEARTSKSHPTDEVKSEAIITDDAAEHVGLDEEKTVEKTGVLKNFLEYKVEFPTTDTCGVKSNENMDPTKERANIERLANMAAGMVLSAEEQMNLMRVYDKLGEGLEQAEEFFKSIGIEWSSSHQMFKVKPKKFLPAMTMIAFGPDYEDVIVCRDDEETGETKACMLSKGDKDCPKDVTAVNLNVYKDGYQPEDDSFYAFSTDSIREFFMNNVGSYMIMKPDDTVPQTILIRIIDERDRSFEDVQKGRAEGAPKPRKKSPKKPKRKSNNQERRSRTEESSYPANNETGQDGHDSARPKYYGPANATPPSGNKAQTEAVEIFDRHKIIKRLEDVEEVEDNAMGPSSWYWKNQRKPMSSEYVVPPNIPTSSTEGQHRQPNPAPNPAAANRKEETNVIESLMPSEAKNKETGGRTQPAPPLPPPQPTTRTNVAKAAPPPVHHPHQPDNQPSDPKINKINIYHGPVTVINLGETSEDSVRLSAQPNQDNRFKVTMQRKHNLKGRPGAGQTGERDNFSEDWDEFVGTWQKNATGLDRNNTNSQRNKQPPASSAPDYWQTSDHRMKKHDDQTSEMFIPDVQNGYNIYESEYEREYGRSAAKWTEFAEGPEARKSLVEANNADTGEYVRYQHITIFGQAPPPEEVQPQSDVLSGIGADANRPSVLLDLAGNTGRPDAGVTSDSVELNKKTSETQITVSLRDNNSGKKYLVNIYPEEQLKRIWSILKLNNINIQQVTPELVLGSPDLTKNLIGGGVGRGQNKNGEQDKLSQLSSKPPAPSARPQVTRENSGDSASNLVNSKAPSIQSEQS